MKISNTFFVILLTVLLGSSTCHKEPDLIPSNPLPPQKEDNNLLVWRKRLSLSGEAYSINPILNIENDIIASELFNTKGDPEIIRLYDGKSGNLKWEWSDYFRHEEHFMDQGHVKVKDVLILSGHNTTYAFNTISGLTVWKHFIDTMYGSHMVFSNENYIYKAYQGEKGRFSNYILRTKYDELKWEMVCTYIDSNKKFDRLNVSSINFTKTSHGDDLMLYTLSCGGTTESYSVICCYNLSKNKFEWIKDHSSHFSELNRVKSVITNQHLYHYARKGSEEFLVVFNVSDGTIAWEKSIPNFGVNMFLYNGNLIALYNGSSPIQCFDQQTGSLVWEQSFNDNSMSKLNFTFGDANLFKNYLFSTQCDNMLILNADNGSIVYNKKVALPGGCLQYGIAINEQERLFYVQDRKYINCYKLPEEVKY